jgi:hypothetical protein
VSSRRKTEISIGWPIPAEMMAKEMKTPTTPKSMIATKFWKNCFFLTWNLSQQPHSEAMSWQHAWHNVSEAIPKKGQSCKLSTTLEKKAALKGLAQYTYKTITREALPLIPSRPLRCNIWIATQTR